MKWMHLLAMAWLTTLAGLPSGAAEPIDLPLRPLRPANSPEPGTAGDPEPTGPLPVQALEDPQGRNLAQFFGRLRQLEQGQARSPVRIVHYGDSHVAADVYTEEIRQLLQARFGDGGPGFVSVGNPPYYRLSRLETGATDGWRAERSRAELRGAEGHLTGLGGYLAWADAPQARAWLRPRSGDRPLPDQVELYTLPRPTGGSLQVLADGSPLRTLATQATAETDERPRYERFSLPPGTQRLDLHPAGDGVVTVLGLVLEERRPGLVYDTLGIGGTQLVHLAAQELAIWADQLRHRDPALVILAYGTNESASPITPPAFEAKLTRYLQRLKAAVPQASCLLIAPIDRAVPDERGNWQTVPRILELVAVQRRVAAQTGCGFWNAYAAMEGKGAIDRWARASPPLALPDRVHLSPPGYRRIARQFVAALLQAYDRSR